MIMYMNLKDNKKDQGFHNRKEKYQSTAEAFEKELSMVSQSGDGMSKYFKASKDNKKVSR